MKLIVLTLFVLIVAGCGDPNFEASRTIQPHFGITTPTRINNYSSATTYNNISTAKKENDHVEN